MKPYARMKWLLISVSRRRRPPHPAKHQLARSDVDLLALKAGVEPDLRHDAVIGIVAPPRAMLLRGCRKLRADEIAPDLAERQRHGVARLPFEVIAEGAVLGHFRYYL